MHGCAHTHTQNKLTLGRRRALLSERGLAGGHRPAREDEVDSLGPEVMGALVRHPTAGLCHAGQGGPIQLARHR